MRNYRNNRDIRTDPETDHYIPNYDRDGYVPGPRYGNKPEIPGPPFANNNPAAGAAAGNGGGGYPMMGNSCFLYINIFFVFANFCILRHDESSNG